MTGRPPEGEPEQCPYKNYGTFPCSCEGGERAAPTLEQRLPICRRCGCNPCICHDRHTRAPREPEPPAQPTPEPKYHATAVAVTLTRLIRAHLQNCVRTIRGVDCPDLLRIVDEWAQRIAAASPLPASPAPAPEPQEQMMGCKQCGKVRQSRLCRTASCADCGGELVYLHQELAKLQERNVRQRSIIESCPSCTLAVVDADEDWPLAKLRQREAKLVEALRACKLLLAEMGCQDGPTYQQARAALGEAPDA